MSKKLQKDSKYALADADGDGIVTDQEMDRHAMWVRLENEDKQADTQRLMAWVAMHHEQVRRIEWEKVKNIILKMVRYIKEVCIKCRMVLCILVRPTLRLPKH